MGAGRVPQAWGISLGSRSGGGVTDSGGVLMGRADLERAFSALGERLVRRGVVLVVAADVFGGERDAVWGAGAVQAGGTADLPGVRQFGDEFVEVGRLGPVRSMFPQPGGEEGRGGLRGEVGRR